MHKATIIVIVEVRQLFIRNCCLEAMYACMVAHICNPRKWRMQEGCEFQASLGYIDRSCLKRKKKKAKTLRRKLWNYNFKRTFLGYSIILKFVSIMIQILYYLQNVYMSCCHCPYGNPFIVLLSSIRIRSHLLLTPFLVDKDTQLDQDEFSSCFVLFSLVRIRIQTLPASSVHSPISREDD